MYRTPLNAGELEKIKREFESHYSRPAEILTAAPGRVNLMGEHIDYNDGFVLPMAVNRYVVIAGARATESLSGRCYSIDLGKQISIPLHQQLTSIRSDVEKAGEKDPSKWGQYLRGVIAGFQQLGVEVPGFDLVIRSTVPIGGGISSSAALTVALATFLESLTETDLEPVQKALLCQSAEHRFANVPCGIMDQFSSVMGTPDELMLIDCRSQDVKLVPFDDQTISVLVINSNVKHDHASGQYAQRRRECEAALAKLNHSCWRDVTSETLNSSRSKLSPIEFRRARHVVEETGRTLATADSFVAGRWSNVGELMYASHESLRDNFEVSTAELDLLVDLAREYADQDSDRGDSDQPIFGARMTGGGFGGCVVVLLKSNQVQSFSNFAAKKYESCTGIQPELFSSRPARGAHVIVNHKP